MIRVQEDRLTFYGDDYIEFNLYTNYYRFFNGEMVVYNTEGINIVTLEWE